MFEGVVAALLRKYLGSYTHVDTAKLKVGFGAIVLRNLKLKPEALAESGLPLEVRAGFIGKITLNIPWTNLLHKPAVIELEDVYAVMSQ